MNKRGKDGNVRQGREKKRGKVLVSNEWLGINGNNERKEKGNKNEMK